MPLIRSLMMLIAVVALLLAVMPGSQAHAVSMDMGTTVSGHVASDGCAPAVASHGQTERHDAGGCGKMQCCLGAICVFAGLPAAALAVPVSTATLDLSVATAFLTGRDVAPPIDPPRPFA